MTPADWIDREVAMIKLQAPNTTESLPEPSTKSLPRPMALAITRHFSDGIRAAVLWCGKKRAQQRGMRRLHVAETLSLGEKRFVSILQVDGAEFLVAGTSTSLSIIESLDKRRTFEELLQQKSETPAERQ